jgi:NitT/TauT family transport system substrate-binding protein
MKSNLDFVVKYIGVSGTAPAANDLYASGFLPTPPIMP